MYIDRPSGGQTGEFIVTERYIEIENGSGLEKATSAFLHRSSHAQTFKKGFVDFFITFSDSRPLVSCLHSYALPLIEVPPYVWRRPVQSSDEVLSATPC